jgi:hypothetical protein
MSCELSAMSFFNCLLSWSNRTFSPSQLPTFYLFRPSQLPTFPTSHLLSFPPSAFRIPTSEFKYLCPLTSSCELSAMSFCFCHPSSVFRLLSLGTRGLFTLCAMPYALTFSPSFFSPFRLPPSDFRIQIPLSSNFEL